MSMPKAKKPSIGLALGSGAARGWAHVGVLKALDEIGVEIDAFAGSSAGALVAAGHLLGELDRLMDWARSLGPTEALMKFTLEVGRGGLINPEKAFQQFADIDLPIENLPKRFGAVATNLATGGEQWLTRGSTLAACRASSAIPLVFQAAHYAENDSDLWLVDGAVSNPVPVSLARGLGADIIIAVDLNSAPTALSRLDRPTTREVVMVEDTNINKDNTLTSTVESFLKVQSTEISRRMALARARANARPQLLETAAAMMDIVQMHLANARTQLDGPDILIAPDLSFASATAFDRHEDMLNAGYMAAIAAKDEILAVCT